MILAVRREAKKAGHLHYFTGKPCLRGHISKRRTGDGSCSACDKERWETEEYKKRRALYRNNNKEKISLGKSEYYEKNKEYLIKKAVEHRKKVKDTPLFKQWYSAYLEKNKDRINNNQRLFRERHPNRVKAWNALSSENRRLRIPLWLSEDHKKIIQAFNKLAKMKTLITGEKHQVDHIIPLQGKLVSGLHVPNNLQIITKFENISKNNTYHIT